MQPFLFLLGMVWLLRLLWSTQDPLEPFVIYWKRYVISGLGIFTAGYVLFSISNIHVLFQQSYGPCWQT